MPGIQDVAEDLRAVEVKQKLDRLRTEVKTVFDTIAPTFTRLQQEMGGIERELRKYVEPAAVAENERLRAENSKLRVLVQECVGDFKHLTACHASEYAARRGKEVTDALAKL